MHLPDPRQSRLHLQKHLNHLLARLSPHSIHSTMPILPVPGADLYYETLGTGPLFLCITGAGGSKENWAGLAQQLQSLFTVVVYDRRGYSRSHLSTSTAQDYTRRLATDANDVRFLVKHLTPAGQEEVATVLGSSSGAIVALEFLSRYPECVRVLISHEPPAHNVLPDPAHWNTQQQEIYDIYRARGLPPALDRFAESIQAGAEKIGLLRAFDPQSSPYTTANGLYWFERELMVYPLRDFENDLSLDAGNGTDSSGTGAGSLRLHRDKLLLVCGRDSAKEAPQYKANFCLREKLGYESEDREVVLLPGAHFGYIMFPQEFMRELLQALGRINGLYEKLESSEL